MHRFNLSDLNSCNNFASIICLRLEIFAVRLLASKQRTAVMFDGHEFVDGHESLLRCGDGSELLHAHSIDLLHRHRLGQNSMLARQQ